MDRAAQDEDAGDGQGISLAPMLLDTDGDVPTRDDLASLFFSRERCLPESDGADLIDDHAQGRARFASPDLRQRQRYLRRYVVSAVAVAGAIGFAALLRVTTAANAMASGPEVRAVAAAPIPQPVPAEAAKAVETAPVVALASPPVLPAVTAPPPTLAPTPAEPSAREERNQALHLLNKSEWAAAAAAGERSVRRDPTDAQTWLILGAAYAERGQGSEARLDYARCVKLARPGPSRSECADLLR
ncbi:MAG: hypothetical protein ACREJ3_15790 [Polyangiaceae bacterium]